MSKRKPDYGLGKGVIGWNDPKTGKYRVDNAWKKEVFGEEAKKKKGARR